MTEPLLTPPPVDFVPSFVPYLPPPEPAEEHGPPAHVRERIEQARARRGPPADPPGQGNGPPTTPPGQGGGKGKP